jgi:hypothetical protein
VVVRANRALMERVELDELRRDSEAFDALAQETPHVDQYCSSSHWTLSAHEAFSPEQELFLFRSQTTWLTLTRGVSEHIGRYLSPLESMWGLASPLLGVDPVQSTLEAIEAFETIGDEWDSLWLCGLDPNAPPFMLFARHFSEQNAVFLGPPTLRHVASLDGGYDAWMARRSSGFRAKLRRALRLSESAGVEIEWLTEFSDDASRRAAFERALAVDDASWKGESAQGLRASEMATFYDRMTERLGRSGELRMMFLKLGGRDIAMGFGAQTGDALRGLQMSYVKEFASYSPGNVLQAKFIERLAAAGVQRYDLGTDLGYKGRWSEPGLETAALVIRGL